LCYNSEQVVPFSRETTKQEELFDYTNVPDYYKEKIMNKNEKS